ncbi:RING-H2 finger protein ATL46-like [Cucurbita moschata]|uniref:RING-type E3 ubiquitin transferase n=2 Tax=Cucurbita TaxID=3660 RepID=A0A6J1FN91_CUCMO
MSFVVHPQTRDILVSPSIAPLQPSSSLAYNSDYQKQSALPSSSSSKISPAVLLVIVILALLFFISGLLHLLVRLLVKQRSSPSSIPESNSNRFLEMSDSSAFQRQLQQLFHLHDSGLDQAFIDALPVFLYKEIVGLKEPFDCAVCLCEFSELDKLRLLPSCSHAFHIDCIDTWLLSNSTCPLCRGTLYSPGLAIENPVYGFEDSEETEESTEDGRRISIPTAQKAPESDINGEKRVFSIRLGKFRNLNSNGGVRGLEKGEGETSSSSSLGARRCYSMGSYQYIVADSELQVALSTSNLRDSQTGNCSVDDDNAEGKKIKIGSKNESFSVSKIWLWSKKGRQPSGADTHVLRAN